MKKGIVVKLAIILVLLMPFEVKSAEDEEFEYLARCVQAEADNQDLKGKRLVADVILNRVEDDRFPNTITDVINAPRQFSVVANGRIDKVEVDEETLTACRLEMEKRIDEEIVYFNNSSKVTGDFCYKWGGHWFAK